MKTLFAKLLSCMMAVCMLLTVFSSCGKGDDHDKEGETTDEHNQQQTQDTETPKVEKSFLWGTYSDKAIDVACYIGDVLYYSLGSRPCLYTYGNGQKQTIYTGGVPVGMTAQGNYLYYLTKGEKTLSRVDITTGAKENLAVGVSNISQYCLYGGAIFVFGQDSDGNAGVYSYNITKKELNPMYTFTIEDGGSGAFTDCIDEDNRYIKIIHCTNYFDDYTKATDIVAVAIDIIENKIYEITQFDYRQFEADGFVLYGDNRLDGFILQNFGFDNEYAYTAFSKYSYGETTYGYYKTNLLTQETELATQEEYDNSLLKKSNTDNTTQLGLSYNYGVQSAANVDQLQKDIYMDGIFQMNEKLYISAVDPLYVSMVELFEGDKLLVFEEIMYSASGYRMMILNKETSQVTEIDFYSSNAHEEYPSGLGGTSVYTGTGWYNSTGGGSSSGGVDFGSSGGANIEPTKPCGLCKGSGQMKCEMCGGDGMMPSLTIVGGGDWEEPCRYCYNGKKQCLACGGDGTIQ